MTPYQVAVDIARKYIGMEEEDGNRGQMIDHWNRLSGVPLGSPWCASFLMFVIEGASNQASMKHKLFKSAHVLSVYNNSKACWVNDPAPGRLVVWQMGESLKGHIGIITEVIGHREVKTIEGNTAKEKSVNREGRVVAEQVRNLNAVGKMKFKGILDPWKGVKASNPIELG
jgi:hypothetical protein